MLSSLESIFYADIQLWDWEEAIKAMQPEAGESAIQEAKQSAWNIIKTNDNYYDVNGVSNVYATMVCMTLERAIEKLMPKDKKVTFFRTIQGKETSLIARVNDYEVVIKDYNSIQALLKAGE